MTIGLRVFVDVDVRQEELSLLFEDEPILKGNVSGAQALDLTADQRQPCLKGLVDMVIVTCAFVGRDSFFCSFRQ